MQTEEIGAESQQLLYGCQMSRLLQDYNGIQPCSDCGVVCWMFHGTVPAHGRKGKADRRMFLQKEAALSVIATE